jgi:hypothetical protein
VNASEAASDQPDRRCSQRDLEFLIGLARVRIHNSAERRSANGMFEALWFASSLSANDCLTIASIPAGNECTLSKLKLNPLYEAHPHNS